MITLLTGNNSYALTRRFNSIKNEFKTRHGESSYEQRGPDDIRVQELPQLFEGLSLFSQERLVVLREVSANRPVWDVLVDHLDDLAVDVILIEPAIDKRTRTFKWLQKHATIETFDELDERGLLQWIQTYAMEQGITIEASVARFLIVHAGNDQWRLFHEIEKLSLLNKPISSELIRNIIDPNPQSSAFELLDAVLAGDKDRARQLLAPLTATEDPYKFVGLLVSQLYALVATVLTDQPSTVVAREMGIHPYVASKAMSVARRMGETKIKHATDMIVDLDMKLKSTGADPWLLIETTLMKIAASQ